MDWENLYIHTVEYYSVIKRNDMLATSLGIQNILLSERSQMKKTTGKFMKSESTVIDRVSGEWENGCHLASDFLLRK